MPGNAGRPSAHQTTGNHHERGHPSPRGHRRPSHHHRHRLIALLTLPMLAGSIIPHASAGWSFSNAGGGWEYPVYLLATAVVVALLGGGRYSITQPKA
ncbi:hypothetical protein [Novilysobacter erysipheiresistens]|uniref:Uncharacterized protein n=1 Tax=Novilysobacter erysipheiresistens TaxID=1749332 RepID=A0ABU7YWV6_9GAMM